MNEIELQLRGYYAGQLECEEILKHAETEARATTQDLLASDNPYFWLMTVLITRKLTSIQIYMAMADHGAFD